MNLTDAQIAELRVPPAKFQAKAWLANFASQQQQSQQSEASPDKTASASTTTTTSNDAVSQLYLALQLQAQECSSVLDDLANQLLSRAPRAIVEIDRCDSELNSLRDTLQGKKKDTDNNSSNPSGSAEDVTQRSTQLREQVQTATEKIRQMQTARQRLHHCKEVLAEAHQLAQRCDATERRVETLCTSKNNATTTSAVPMTASVTFSAVAEDIAALRRSIALIQAVEPTVIKPAANRVAALETRFQQFAESDVLSTLVKAAQMGPGAAAATPGSEESLAAMTTIGRMPDLLRRALASLAETRKAKLIQEMNGGGGAATTNSSASASASETHVRRSYASAARYMEQDFEHMVGLLSRHFAVAASKEQAQQQQQQQQQQSEAAARTPTPSATTTSNASNKTTTAANDAPRATILAAVLDAGLTLVEALQPRATKHVATVSVSKALDIGSKVVAAFDTLAQLSNAPELDKTRWEKVVGTARAPFQAVAANLESHEQKQLNDVVASCFVANAATGGPSDDGSSSAATRIEQLLPTFTLVHDAIVASAKRCFGYSRRIAPDAAQRVAPIWADGLKLWAKRVVDASSASSSASGSNSAKSEQQYRATLRSLLEVSDAAKSLPERAAALEGVVSQLSREYANQQLQQQQPQPQQTGSKTIEETLAPGITAVRGVQKHLQDSFLQQLMAPAVHLVDDFVKFANSQQNHQHQDPNAATNSPSSSSNVMPSEKVRALGAWCMELPMLLEAVGADPAAWSGVAAGALLNSFCAKLWPTNAEKRAKNGNNGSAQQQADVEYFAAVMQAVDDRLDLSRLKVNTSN